MLLETTPNQPVATHSQNGQQPDPNELVPVFIGYTETASAQSINDLRNLPVRISSMLEFQQYFGAAPASTSAEVRGTTAFPAAAHGHFESWLYFSLELFFANGGANCYVISVGSFASESLPNRLTIGKPEEANDILGDLCRALDSLENFEGPNAIAIPDALMLSDAEWAQLHRKALDHCHRHGNRKLFIDIKESEQDGMREYTGGIDTFRDTVTEDDLSCCTACAPLLKMHVRRAVSMHDLRFRLPQLRHVSRGIEETVVTVPPCGAITGLMAAISRSDRAIHPDFRLNLEKIVGLSTQLSQDEYEYMRNGAHITAIIESPAQQFTTDEILTAASTPAIVKHEPARKVV